MRKVTLVLCLWLLVSLSAKAQTGGSLAVDTLLLFMPEDLYTLMLQNHPVIRQAELLEEQAKQELRAAAGNFDPKLAATWDRKDFKGDEYYDVLQAQVKVPTWFPIDPSLTVDRNQGIFLNPEQFISEDTDFWQLSTGVSLPIGKGLFIDQRRAAVQQSRALQSMLFAERVGLINKILLKATKDYWNWYRAWHEYQQLSQSIDLSREILDRVRTNFELGEAAKIDTIQASITLQSREIEWQESAIGLAQTTLQLSVHLWGEQGEPLELLNSVRPPDVSYASLVDFTLSLDELVNHARQSHPDLLKLLAKQEQLRVDQKLARENLKPQLDLTYYFINSPIAPEGAERTFALDENYKFGLEFSFPLFLRKERAKVQKAGIKLQDNNLEMDKKQLDIVNALKASWFGWQQTQLLIGRQSNAIASYEDLLEAELLNLELGESDLFKINFQQEKLIQSRIKLLKLQSQLRKIEMELYFNAGYPRLNR